MPPRSMSPTTHDRQPELAGQAHVDVVARAEVDLRRGAGALDTRRARRSLRARGRRRRRPRPGGRARRHTARPRGCRAGSPRTTTNARRSVPGLSSTGFMAVVGSSRAACAWRYCARPISPPSRQTIELFDMFCALKGATFTPRRARARHRPATTTDLPASDDVPATRRPDGAEGDGGTIRPSCPTAARHGRTTSYAAEMGSTVRRANAFQRGAAPRSRRAARARGSSSGCCTALDLLAHRIAPRRPRPERRGSPAIPVGLLTTTGATVGAAAHRAAMLAGRSTTGGASSRRASARSGRPAWYFNLRAHPQATLEVDGVTHPVRAEQVQGPDRERVRAAALAILSRATRSTRAGRWARPRLLRAAPRARLSGLGVQRLEGQLTRGRRRRAGGRACAGSP